MSNSLVASLLDGSRPTFLIGEVPPMEKTSPGQAQEICGKFIARARSMPCDGYIIYDIQDEEGRSESPRPFPFRRLMDPSGYASLVSKTAGKDCLVYKCVNDANFEEWLDTCEKVHGHRAINVVGRATATGPTVGPSMADAMAIVRKRTHLHFGCVCIAERHTPEYAATRGYAAPREHENMLRKQQAGAEWFISQAVYDAKPTIALLRDYAAACRERGMKPKKVVLTFTPVSRPKTLAFVKWLGVTVPKEAEEAILSEETNELRAEKSIDLLCACLDDVLDAAKVIDVPLGISVESVSIYKAEINAVHVLFAKLQQRILDAQGIKWTVQWNHVLLDKENQESKTKTTNTNTTVVFPPPPSSSDVKKTPHLPGETSPYVMAALGATIMALGILLGRKAF
eukprot:CAMPEP_0118913754 /NCGR_PEP_ID=MMETSP1166-20130328/14422_1 /TAXON_ID=1104430 /ORGANISM="Chrysoreinhardia sp, Strain CCMP3193" /LENGTH=397 /DNA_ID=CAMNT_0006853319 /DNA_START=3 /DNA_END=1196 /DNA_ORIENTATION=-